MSRLDTLTGKHHAEFYFFDQYDAFVPNVEEINVESGPVFSTEQDALAAEELAHKVMMETLMATSNRP